MKREQSVTEFSRPLSLQDFKGPQEATSMSSSLLSPNEVLPPGGLHSSRCCASVDHYETLKREGIPATHACLICAIEYACEKAGFDVPSVLRWAFSEASVGRRAAEELAGLAIARPHVFISQYRVNSLRANLRDRHTHKDTERLERVREEMRGCYTALVEAREDFGYQLTETPLGAMLGVITSSVASALMLLEDMER